MNELSSIDHGRSAVLEAQRIANFFVDEARLSGHSFTTRQLERLALIDNYDSYIVEKDLSWIQDGQSIIMELYYF